LVETHQSSTLRMWTDGRTGTLPGGAGLVPPQGASPSVRICKYEIEDAQLPRSIKPSDCATCGPILLRRLGTAEARRAVAAIRQTGLRACPSASTGRQSRQVQPQLSRR
jgi:hypothetical protein